MIDLFSHSEASSRSILCDYEVDRKDKRLMFPLGKVLSGKMIVDLHLDDLILYICDSMLRGIFERETASTVLITHIFAFQQQSREVSHKECTALIASQSDGTGIIMNFEGVG